MYVTKKKKNTVKNKHSIINLTRSNFGHSSRHGYSPLLGQCVGGGCVLNLKKVVNHLFNKTIQSKSSVWYTRELDKNMKKKKKIRLHYYYGIFPLRFRSCLTIRTNSLLFDFFKNIQKTFERITSRQNF